MVWIAFNRRTAVWSMEKRVLWQLLKIEIVSYVYLLILKSVVLIMSEDFFFWKIDLHKLFPNEKSSTHYACPSKFREHERRSVRHRGI